MKRNVLSLMLIAAACVPLGAETLTLEQCRELARQNNKELRIADSEKMAACWTRKSAFTNYLPKISAEGGYAFTSKPVSLLDEDQKSTLTHMGDIAAGAANQLPIPLGSLLQEPLNAVGQKVVDAFESDTRNSALMAVTLTQPVYMGGKIRAYNKIAALAEEAAGHKLTLAEQNLLVEVDETYWQIVSLESKKELAQAYLNVVTDLDNDVQAMIKEGVATKADGLSVKVKVNQANVALIQATNGVALLKMLLCQLCGLDENTELELIDEPVEDLAAIDGEINRPELAALESLAAIGRQKINLARAETLPNVALMGGYAMVYPSLFNGFEKRFTGLWNVGVMVKIPLVTWGDRFYKVKAARAQSVADELRLDSTREKINLQVSQSRQKVAEAQQSLEASRSAVEAADENLRFATLGMKEGVIPVINVNEAQTAWLSARSQLISSQIDLKLAQLHLKKALGQL